MSLRYRFAVPVLSAALIVTLAGCGSDGAKATTSTSSTSAAAASAKLEDVTVTGGDAKAAPTLKFKSSPFSVSELTTKVLKEGSGVASTDKDVVLVDYALVNGKDGATVDENYSSEPVGFSMSDTQLISGLRSALTGVKPGTRLLTALPPKDAFGDQGLAQLKVGGTDTVLFVLDVIKMVKPLPVAAGTAVKARADLPAVVFNDGKAATITMPTSEPPKKLVVQPLIEGAGPVVKDGQTALVTYTGAIWRNGQVFDSSFSHGSTFSFPVGGQQVISGWDTGVSGEKVGSRLLLIVPPAEGYGDAGSGDIKGTDTIVFVVDILAAY